MNTDKPNDPQARRARRAPKDDHLRGSRHRPKCRLIDGYRQMARDAEHEAQTLEWCEALVADVGGM